MINKTLTIHYPGGEYPIYIGSQLLSQSDCLVQHIRGKQVFIVTDTTVADLYLEKLTTALASMTCDHLILPDGEAYKTLATCERIWDHLIEQQHHRDTTLIALGGGVIGDMTGFAASAYQRGVPFIQIPTTLLAQVDASIGGKTAVNHPKGKNMMGAFYQPQAVIVDRDTLTTLPDREFRAGLAEIIKAALLADAKFFHWLQKNMSALLARDPDSLMTAIATACQIKATIVSADEKEKNVRALLNLGHTFGHAIEHSLGYGTLLHGEAVAIGLLMAAQLSATRGHITPTEVTHIAELLKKAGLPTQLPASLTHQQWLQAMQQDKKILHGKMRFILLKSIGKAYIAEDVTEQDLLALLTAD